MKIKIIHKGLILVAVPLIFGIVFISLLCFGLGEANRLVERELMLKDAMITHITATRGAAAVKLCRLSYLGSHDQFFKERYRANKELAQSSDERLHEMLKNERSLPEIPSLDISTRQLFHGGMNNMGGQAAGSPFLHRLQKLTDKQTKAALNAMNSLQGLLIGGMIAGFAISAALALYFCLNITNRLLVIVNNTINLSNGSPLIKPLKGSDEIAELDQLLYKSGTEIRELERFKREMIGVVSHELKSPLSSVGAFLSSLAGGVYGELTEKAKDKVNRTYNNVKRLMGLVAELLYLDRLELDIKPDQIELKDLLSVVLDIVKELSEQLKIEIVVQNDGGKVFVDRDRIVQVIVNLLSNAMKFSPPGGKVTLETKVRDGWFECRVSDQGRGIPEEFRKQIFEPFKQVDAKDATAKKGTGLGLTISKSIVEQHGGIIGVDSEEGMGSTFWFKVPEKSLADSKAKIADSAAAMPALANAKGSMRKYGVLQQGLIIISVPLIFQLAFGSVIGYMLFQVRQQTKKEETSKELLDCMNRAAETLAGSSNFGMMYAFTRNPSLLNSWSDGKQKVMADIEHAQKLCKGNPEKLRDIQETVDAVNKLDNLIITEGQKGNNNRTARKILEMGGMGKVADMASSVPVANDLINMQKNGGPGNWGPGAADSQGKAGTGAQADGAPHMGRRGGRMRAMIEQMGGHGPGGLRAIVEQLGGNGAMEQMMAMQQSMGPGHDSPGMPHGMGADPAYAMGGLMSAFMNMGAMNGGGMGAMGMLKQFQALMADSINIKMTRPFLEAQSAQDRMMEREREASQQLADKRSAMIKTLQVTLLGGIALNVILSILLAIFLMRHLTSRLQHVMENTHRLVKRETLDPPISGNDEIAYLDKVLFQTGNRLVELENFKRELISIVSHELRTPLLSISSALELLGTGMMGNLTEKGSRRLGIAQDETARLIRLVNDLLDIEKMEAGKFVLDTTQTDASDLVNKAIFATTPLADARGIKLVATVPDSNGKLVVDRDRLTQVLINLLSNAIKFSPDKETINITVESANNGKEQVKFSVIDRGRGIPAEAKQKIFDRFTQVEEKDFEERGGSGLGLAISKAIVQQHGGDIGVDSTLGAGSTFWFTVPKESQN